MSKTKNNLIHLAIRIGPYEDPWDKKKLIGDTIKEHNKITQVHKKVYLGKLGMPIADFRVDQLRKSIEDQRKLNLIIIRRKGLDYEGFAAPLISVNSEGFSPLDFLVPKYYRHLIPEIANWFEIKKIAPLSAAYLSRLKLVSSGNSLIKVLKTCRTSTMLVKESDLS